MSDRFSGHPNMAPAAAGMKPRLVVCDEYRLEAEGLARLLESEFDVLQVLCEMPKLADAVARLRADVVVHGLSKEVPRGLDVVTQIQSHAPTARIVVVTTRDDAKVAVEAFRRGASAYVLKSSEVAELIQSVRTVLLGHSYATPAVAAAMVAVCVQPKRDTPLTARQHTILQQLANGKSMKEVAATLNVTPRTIAFHKYTMMRTLKITTSAELVRFAVTHGIV